MLLDLNKLPGSGARVERTFLPSAFDPQDDLYRVAALVVLSMDVQRIGEGVFGVAGTVSTRLAVECSRCIEPFEVPLDATFDLRYVPETDDAAGAEREVGDDELETTFHREGKLDLIELLREQLVLALPMKPLCQAACAGLCPTCGTNLNSTRCDCAPSWDPRLASLKSLVIPDKEN